MKSKVTFCIVLGLALVACGLAASVHDNGHGRYWPSRLHVKPQPGTHASVFNLSPYIQNAANYLNNLDYDQILALLEEYLKGK